MKIKCRIENGNKIWRNNKGQLHRIKGPAIEYANGSKAWFQNDRLHRMDGPAGEFADGTKEWFQNGLRHRDDGPAVEGFDGYKAWYQNGKKHRTNGPAVEYNDGYKEWWIKGKQYTEEELEELNKLNNKLDIDIKITINGKQYKLVPID